MLIGAVHVPGTRAPTLFSRAMVAATLPYLLTVADLGVRGAATASPALAKGLTTLGGQLVSAPVAAAHDLPLTDPGPALTGSRAHGLTGLTG